MAETVDRASHNPTSPHKERGEIWGTLVPWLRKSFFGVLFLGAVGLAGCRSRFIEVTIVNQGPAMHVMEFDYPSASFGANQVASGAEYHYRFKVQGPGSLSLQYEDAAGHMRSAAGPKVELGDEGTLRVSVDGSGGVSWKSNLTQPR